VTEESPAGPPAGLSHFQEQHAAPVLAQVFAQPRPQAPGPGDIPRCVVEADDPWAFRKPEYVLIGDPSPVRKGASCRIIGSPPAPAIAMKCASNPSCVGLL
jgi:hypothetical protein